MSSMARTIEGSSYLRIREASVYTGLSVSTLYKKTAPSVAEIPVYKIGGSVLLKREDLDNYMNSNRRCSRDEMREMAAGRGRRQS